MLQWLLAQLFGLVKKDYKKDYEDEIRGQYADGNYMYDKDGNQLTLDEALDTAPDFNNPFQGINDFFSNIGGSVKNLFGLINGFFGGLKNLPQSELFNQSFSWLNQFTGANLTGQQQQMNDFNAEQAAIQRGWQERMSNTSYQRAVSDFSQAGLNPALLMGGSPGATTPSGASASGTSMSAQGAVILDMIMQKANLAMQDKMSQRQSDTAIKTSQIAADATVEAAKANASALHEGNVIRLKELEQRIVEARSKIRLEEEQAKTEEQKRNAIAKSMLVDEATANRINELLPYEKAVMTADTAEKRWHAELDMVEAGFKNSLISNGLIHHMMESYRVSGDVDKIKRDILEMTRRRYQDADTPFHHMVHGLSSLISDVTSSYLVDPSSLLKVPLK